MSQRQVHSLEFEIKTGRTYSGAARKGNMVFISGMVGNDPATGRIVAKYDVVAQARQAYTNIKYLLEKLGATMGDVVKTTDYIVAEALPSYKQTAQVRREFLGDQPPAATGIVVHRLLDPDALIEIDAIAIVD
ncbi:MAG TPA: RidA family protein [Dehalococcoidia bacterium]|jgi:enamine deaminase RidA (YjgF/YER057c/UK114 family)|nr:RidA family protein [Dehalococcoidia bacterium]